MDFMQNLLEGYFKICELGQFLLIFVVYKIIFVSFCLLNWMVLNLINILQVLNFIFIFYTMQIMVIFC
jgi:hypothetical protein